MKNPNIFIDYTTRISVDYCKYKNGSTMPELHMHTHYELSIVYKGVLRVNNGGEQLDIAAPCVLFHRPLTMHNVNASHEYPYERYIIYFSDTVAERLREMTRGEVDVDAAYPSNLTAAPLSEGQIEALLPYLEALFHPAGRSGHTEEYLLVSLIFCALSDGRTEPLPSGLRSSCGYIGEVMRCIAENDCRDFKLDRLHERFFVSAAKLRADFRETTGLSLKQYQQNVRVSRAKASLESGRSLTETMLACNFNSVSDFIRVFRKNTGQTPAAYSRQAENKKSSPSERSRL